MSDHQRMIPRLPAVSFLLLAACVAVAGCQKKKPPAKPQPKLDFAQELPPGRLALRKVSPGEYPDFTVAAEDVPRVREAVAHSLAYLRTPSSRGHFPYLDITHERAVATLERLGALLDAAAAQGGGPGARYDLNGAVRDGFEVYKSIGAPNPDNSGYSGQVLFTGYFTPIYEASLTRQGPFQWPLYKRPVDLAGGELGPDGAPAPAQRMTPDGLAPYYTRAEIEQPNGPLQGQELVWMKDRFQAYVVTVQGSARLRLTDGRIMEVGYAGTNGHSYVSPGRRMVADGVIRPEDLSLKTMSRVFAERPQLMDTYLPANPRTTFFTVTSGGPFGSLGVPVTPFATIATDKSVYPRAMPAFLVVPVPAPDGGTRPFRGILLDQDTGGAIRAAGRCDIYMGVGADAEQLAGRQLETGELYYLAVKSGQAEGGPGR